jgi:hypothetical protein|nr:MAG TPA: hypothetical protein [Crassvirales sp.]
MIKYNKLQIDGNKLIIDFEIEDKPYYDSLSIEGVRVDTPLTYGTDTPYFLYDEDDVTQYTTEIFIPDAKKELLIITPIVYISLPPDTPCGADVIDMAAIYDRNILIDKGLGYLKELGDTCEISRGFVDFILNRYALDMAIATCNYSTAIKYWKMLTMVKGTTLKGCGCNGR